MSIVTLYTAAKVDTEAAAMIDVQEDGVIETIDWSMICSPAAAIAEVSAQISFGSGSSHRTNDARQVISTCKATCLAAEPLALNKAFNVNIPVHAGERIYLHIDVVGTNPTAMDTTCHLHIADKSKRTTRRRA